MGNSTSKKVFGDILGRLISEELDPADQDFWDQLWKTPLTVEEIFDLMTPEAVRTLISQQPGNLQTLVTQAVAQLYQVVETPYPIYFDQALNCARILSRLLPFLLENTSTASVSPALRRLLWQKQRVPRDEGTTEGPEGGNRRRGSSDENIGTGGLLHSIRNIDEKSNSEESFHDENELKEVDLDKDEDEEEEEQETEPLAVILVNSLFHLLFLPDFTIEDPNMDFNEQDLGTQTFKSAIMWAPGVGCPEKSLANSSQYDKNRIEILRLMLASFSDSLYQNPDTYDSCESFWLEVATSPDVPYAEIAFCSLLNVVLGYDPIGYGVPYGNLVGGDTAFSLMEISIQVLIVLLDYGHPISPNVSEGDPGMVTYVSADDDHAHGFNIFRRMLRDIDDPTQLNFIFRGFSRLLNNVHLSQTTFLPNSITKISIDQELMVLLWKCLEEIPSFLPFILKESNRCDVNQLVVPVCYFLLDGRSDASKLGMVYLCTFVLLRLSGERNFSVALNMPYKAQLPVDMPLFKGSHADLVIIVLHKLMVSGMDKLSSLYTCFLTIICNVSPYCKALCAPAAHKLVNLVELFASSKVFFASESNYTSVVMLLESLNNLVQYQYEGSFNLVFSILTRRRVFEWLNGFTVPSGEPEGDIAEMREQKSRKEEEVANKDEYDTPSSTSERTAVISLQKEEREFDDTRDEDAGHEKEEGENDENEVSSSLDEKKDNVAIDDHVENNESCTASSDIILSSTDNEEGIDTGNTSPTQPRPSTASSIEEEQHLFKPTPEWVARVKKELPLHTIMRLLRYLVPLLEELAASPGMQKMDELSVLGFVRRTTVVGILPVPHPIVIRKYQPNKFTSLWFTAFMWGVIFLHNQSSPKLYDGKGVRLFIVQGGAAAKLS